MWSKTRCRWSTWCKMGRSEGSDGLASQLSNSPGLNHEGNRRLLPFIRTASSLKAGHFLVFFGCLERCYRQRSKSKHLTMVLTDLVHKLQLTQPPVKHGIPHCFSNMPPSLTDLCPRSTASSGQTPP